MGGDRIEAGKQAGGLVSRRLILRRSWPLQMDKALLFPFRRANAPNGAGRRRFNDTTQLITPTTRATHACGSTGIKAAWVYPLQPVCSEKASIDQELPLFNRRALRPKRPVQPRSKYLKQFPISPPTTGSFQTKQAMQPFHLLLCTALAALLAARAAVDAFLIPSSSPLPRHSAVSSRRSARTTSMMAGWFGKWLEPFSCVHKRVFPVSFLRFSLHFPHPRTHTHTLTRMSAFGQTR